MNQANEVQQGETAAEKPTQIPTRDWKAILKRVKTRLGDDNLSLVSAGIAFYGLLSLFPLVIALVSIYSLFADPHLVEQQLQNFADVIPEGAYSIISAQLKQVVAQSSTALGWSTALSILAALWSANKGTSAVIDGFNIAYEEEDERSFIKRSLTSLALTLGMILFMILALTLVAFLPPILSLLQIDQVFAAAVDWGRWLFLAMALVLGLAILHRFAPHRHDAKWRWVSVGAVASTVLWMVVSAGFSFYVSNFGKYNETYGSLAGVVVLLLWFYLSAFIVLLGAELNAETELQTIRDTTRGEEKPMGRRGAVKADNVPRAG